MRILTMGRDRLRPLQPPPDGNLVPWLNQLNADWVHATRRVSPALLVEFLSIVGPQFAAYQASLDPEGAALFGVAWAGEEASANWFDIGRNYTEYWHHQQQIRDATGAPPLNGREWLHPVLALFVRALPETYREVQAEPGRSLNLRITGAAGGRWVLMRADGKWVLLEGESPHPAVEVSFSDDTAWRLFTKGLQGQEAAARLEIAGDQVLGAAMQRALAIMA
jgi:hypothetical protein